MPVTHCQTTVGQRVDIDPQSLPPRCRHVQQLRRPRPASIRHACQPHSDDVRQSNSALQDTSQATSRARPAHISTAWRTLSPNARGAARHDASHVLNACQKWLDNSSPAARLWRNEASPMASTLDAQERAMPRSHRHNGWNAVGPHFTTNAPIATPSMNRSSRTITRRPTGECHLRHQRPIGRLATGARSLPHNLPGGVPPMLTIRHVGDRRSPIAVLASKAAADNAHPSVPAPAPRVTASASTGGAQ